MGIRSDILVVEDSEADRRLLLEAFRESGQDSRLSFVSDGLQALDYLDGKGAFASAVRPRLILLDLNLPKKDGRSVLAAVKRRPEYRNIPVIIFTTSVADDDISDCYDSCANCYIAKPNDLEKYLSIIKYIEEFWLKTVELPSRAVVNIAVEAKKLH